MGAENKLRAAGEKMQRLGCMLTVLLTVPILLTLFLGIPGLIIGGLVFVLGLAGFLGSGKKKAEEKEADHAPG